MPDSSASMTPRRSWLFGYEPRWAKTANQEALTIWSATFLWKYPGWVRP